MPSSGLLCFLNHLTAKRFTFSPSVLHFSEFIPPLLDFILFYFICSEDQRKDEKAIVDGFKQLMSPGHLFVCYSMDITTSLQRQHLLQKERAGLPLWKLVRFMNPFLVDFINTITN
jgi:hypothetical protein